MPEQGAEDASDRPAWAKDAIFYQIFPDRFARSERVAKPANLLPWQPRRRPRDSMAATCWASRSTSTTWPIWASTRSI